HDAGAERRLGADHDQIDILRLAERNHRRVVGDIERHDLAVAGDAGVARRAKKPLDQRTRRDLPGERMLASARAEKKDIHARSAGPLVFGGWCSMARLLRKGSPPAIRHRVYRTTRAGAQGRERSSMVHRWVLGPGAQYVGAVWRKRRHGYQTVGLLALAPPACGLFHRHGVAGPDHRSAGAGANQRRLRALRTAGTHGLAYPSARPD